MDNKSSSDGNMTQVTGTTNGGKVSHPHELRQPPPSAAPHPPPSHLHLSQLPPQQHVVQQQGSDEQRLSESNKRTALSGQWRTPPHPVYSTSASLNQPPSHHQQQHHPHPPQQQPPPPQQVPSGPRSLPPLPQPPGIPAPTNLPNNSDDYAKALQEAYRRGAEAAAAMAVQQQQHMSPSASCPNFQMPVSPAPPPQAQHPPPHEESIMQSRSEEMKSSANAYSHSHAPPPPHVNPGYHTQYVEIPVLAQHGPPPVLQHAPHPQLAPPPHQHPRQHPTQQLLPPPPTHQYAAPPQPPTFVIPGLTPAATPQPAVPAPPPPTAVPNPLSNMPPPPNKQRPHSAAQPTPPPPPATAVPGSAQFVDPPPQQRSVSLPDMSTYAVQAEEEKRQKRLARNRASARLRRLRKKNLVDAYETEVGILEKTLQQLKAHVWGVPACGPSSSAGGREKSHQSLLEALCMDRGQQVISSEQRAQQCQDILEQQLQQMDLLRQVQFEQLLLAAASNSEQKDDDLALAEMAAELNHVLGLSDDQKARLLEGSKGLDDEMKSLDTVLSSLVIMKENEWLLNQGVQDVTDQLTTILHKNQMSKFLLWADANVEAIDQLDHVHAAPKTSSHPQGPIFTFGVETTPMEEEGDSK